MTIIHLKQKSLNCNEQGVALLFALGILSLLMILGLGFVTNAMLAQRVAYNNAARSQAKVLAKTAINRVTAALMYEQIRQNGSVTDNFVDVFSRRAADSSVPAGFDDALDGLAKDTLNSLLSVTVNGTEYKNDKDAKWQFLKDVDSRLIGRIAYRILPPPSRSRIDLDHLLTGYYELDTASGITPWTYRIGAEINELNIKKNDLFSTWHFDGPAKTPFPAAGSIVAELSTFYPLKFETDTKKTWLAKWFDQVGNVANDIEAYSYSGTGSSEVDKGTINYHRFDLKRTDWDTALGLGAEKNNSADMVNRLMMIDSNNNNLDIAGICRFYMSDTKSLPEMGLPFLKMIGNSKESFDLIQTRRRQIAANLIDYCDTDSIPTSDVAAAEWKNNLADRTKWPTYTGNEKKANINELILGFSTVAKFASGTGEFASLANAAVEVELKPELIAELIDLYGVASAAENYKLYAGINSLKLTLKLTAKGSISIEDTATPPATTTVNFSETEAAIESPVDNFTFGEECEISFEPGVTGKSKWENGYLVENVALTGLSKNKYKFDLSTILTGKVTAGYSPSAITYTELKLEVTKVEFKFNGICLNDSSDSGVDFVRWPEETITITPASAFLISGENLNFSGDTINLAEQDSRFYLAGIEAIDPRQNLNFKTGTDTSDWSLSSNIKLLDRKNNSDGDGYGLIGTIKIKPEATTAATRFVGFKNTDSTPNQDPDKGDMETVTDPAYSGTSGMSTAYIANRPMRSLWEIGAIHRGAKWETINIKNAGSRVSAGKAITLADHDPAFLVTEEAGFSYGVGDGGILDQTKIVKDNQVRSHGKFDLNAFQEQAADDAEIKAWDRQFGKGMFAGIRLGHKYSDLNTDAYGTFNTVGTELTDAAVTAISEALYTTPRPDGKELTNRAALLEWNIGGKFYENGFGNLITAANDAAQEEFIGKTINLMKTIVLPPTSVQAIVVAQTIRDIGGEVVRIKTDGTALEPVSSALGTFDPPVNDSVAGEKIYYDEITSEIKMLVTFEWSSSTGKLQVKQIEYID